MTLISHLPPLEKEREKEREKEKEPKFSPFQSPLLECHGHGSSHRVEDFGCTTPSEHLGTFFTTRKLI